MKTEKNRYSHIDRLIFQHPRPPQSAGIDSARAPGLVWLRGEHDAAETVSDFLGRACREAREAGFGSVQISGFINTADDAQ